MITDTFGALPMDGMLLVGIAGAARSGKNTAATVILNHLGAGWGQDSFGRPLKEMLNTIGVDTGDNYKDLPANQFGVSTRHMMQTLGTEWGRNMIDPDLWVNIFANMNRGRKLVVPDVRFENEAKLVREHGLLIHIIGRGGVPGGHVSEKPIQMRAGDFVIGNHRDVGYFHELLNGDEIKAFLAEIGR